jgi:hypothetical protein
MDTIVVLHDYEIKVPSRVLTALQTKVKAETERYF